MNTSNGSQTLDLSKSETLTCEDCDNRLFIQSFVIKRLSAIVSPTGEDAIIPVQVYSCGNCGKVPKIFAKDLE